MCTFLRCIDYVDTAERSCATGTSNKGVMGKTKLFSSYVKMRQHLETVGDTYKVTCTIND